MAAFGGLGIGLSFLFGCILLFFVGQIYYYHLLCWKKRNTGCTEIESHYYTNTNTNYAKRELSSLFSWKKKTNSEQVASTKSPELTGTSSVATKPEADFKSHHPEPDLLEVGPRAKDYGEEEEEEEEGDGGGVEAELKRLHNLWGPPRFLFSIEEESKEDLESNDGKSRKRSRTRSLSDILVVLDHEQSPILTSLGESYGRRHHHGLVANPLFESSVSDGRELLDSLRSSPPPTFKFLKDAEDKLMRRLMELEAERRALKAHTSSLVATEERDGSFIRIVVGKS